MNKNMIFAFMAGVAVGVGGAYYYLNKKFEERLKEEVESVKNSFGQLKTVMNSIYGAPKNEEPEESKQSEKKIIDKVQKDYEEYAKHVENYTNYSAICTEPQPPIYSPTNPDIEYISPDDFGENEDYEECFYTYFNDDIMIEGAIRNEEMIIDDPYVLIGDKDDFSPHIGEHEEITLIGVNHTSMQYFEVTFLDEPYNEEE